MSHTLRYCVILLYSNITMCKIITNMCMDIGHLDETDVSVIKINKLRYKLILIYN